MSAPATKAAGAGDDQYPGAVGDHVITTARQFGQHLATQRVECILEVIVMLAT